MADAPVQPTDEDINLNVEEPGGEPEDATPESTPQPEDVDQPQDDPADEPADDPAPSDDEPAEDEPKQPSRRETLRVQTLLKKYGNPAQRQQQPQTQPAPQQVPNYQEMIDADPTVYDQLNKATSQYGDQRYTQGQNETLQQVQTVKWETMLNVDTPVVEQKFDILNPESENFHPALADTINELYLNQVGYDRASGLVANGALRYKDFVEGYMELADEIATTKTAKTTQNIAKQAANTGLRPDGSSAKRLNLNQPVENMSDEELEAYGRRLGLAPTKN